MGIRNSKSPGPVYKPSSSSEEFKPENVRALSIGINYYGTSNELKACVTDALNHADFIRSYCTKQNLSLLSVVMRDHPGETTESKAKKTYPDAKNILSGLDWLLSSAPLSEFGNASVGKRYPLKAGTLIYLSNSSHGAGIKDTSGDEKSNDRQDEVIVGAPGIDGRYGLVVDDRIRELLQNQLVPGCHMTTIMDLCESGTIMDQPYMVSDKKTKVYRKEQYPELKCPLVVISGCSDKKVSLEVSVGGKRTGALTYTILKIFESSPNLPLLDRK